MLQSATSASASRAIWSPGTSRASAAPGASLTPSGSFVAVLVCPGTQGSQAQRYVFGHVDEESASVTYAGLQATGGAAPDGLFLYVVSPGAPDADLTIFTNGRAVLGLRGGIFSAAQDSGTRQPLGCWLDAG